MICGLTAELTSAIGKAAPCNKGLRKIGAFVPDFFVNQGLQACAISSRHRAEDPECGLPLREVARHAFRFCFFAFPLHASGKRVGILRLFQSRDFANRTIEQINLMWESIAEETGNSQCHIDARPLEV